MGAAPPKGRAGNETPGEAEAADASRALPPPLPALEAAHLTLMALYVATLGDATRLPALFVTRRWVERNRAWLIKPPWLALGFAARLFAESHVKKKLRELSDGYVQLEAALSVTREAAYREWLKQTREAMDGFRESLSSGGRLRLALGASWPALTGILGTLGLRLTLPGSVDVAALLLIAGAVVVVLGPYLYLFLRSSFLVKRDLFLPGARLLERSRGGGVTGSVGHVYQAENDLFALLGRRKKQEAPIDALGLLAVLIVPGLVAVAGLVGLLDVAWGSAWASIIATFVFIVIVIPPLSITVRRKWR